MCGPDSFSNQVKWETLNTHLKVIIIQLHTWICKLTHNRHWDSIAGTNTKVTSNYMDGIKQATIQDFISKLCPESCGKMYPADLNDVQCPSTEFYPLITIYYETVMCWRIFKKSQRWEDKRHMQKHCSFLWRIPNLQKFRSFCAVLSHFGIHW